MPTRILLERDVDIPMSDGTVLRGDVYRPDDTGTHPVLVQRTPYDKAFFPFAWVVLDPTKMAGAGYAVVISDVRGRFASEGDFNPYVNEARDGHDTIEWAAGRPWSDGNVGTYGVSYMGQSQWLAAATGPPSLRCIAAATSPHDAHHDLVHRGGALCLGVLASWSMITIAPRELVRRAGGNPNFLADFVGLVEDIDAVDKPLRTLPLVPFAPLRRGGDGPIMPLFEDDVRAEVREQRHEQMSSSHRHDRIEVPALQLAGWYDLCVQADLDHFTAMRERAANEQARRLTRILVGPWAHSGFAGAVGMVDFGMRANGILLDLREDLTGLHRRWFDARLRGQPTGIDDEPPVKLFVMGRNRWRTEDEWPLRRARTENWYPTTAGGLTRAAPSAGPGGAGTPEPAIFTLDPEDPVPTTGGNLLMHPAYLRGPVEQSRVEARSDVLVFTSDPLSDDYEVTGRVGFVAYVAAETVDTDVVARLCDVRPDGTSYNVVDGIRRLRFRDSLSQPEPATPGEVYRVEVDLWSTSHVFLRGHRLRLQVTASDFPRYDRCPGSGESSATASRILPQRNRLFLDAPRPSHLELPSVAV